jgi:hypothetical protein
MLLGLGNLVLIVYLCIILSVGGILKNYWSNRGKLTDETFNFAELKLSSHLAIFICLWLGLNEMVMKKYVPGNIDFDKLIQDSSMSHIEGFHIDKAIWILSEIAEKPPQSSGYVEIHSKHLQSYICTG